MDKKYVVNNYPNEIYTHKKTLEALKVVSEKGLSYFEIKAIKATNNYNEYLRETPFIWKDSWERDVATKTEEEYNLIKEYIVDNIQE